MLIPVWTFFLAGFWRSKSLPIGLIPSFIKGTIPLKSHFWISFVAYSLLLGSIYIVNQIVDRESDRLNKKLFLIPLGIIPIKLALSVFGILVIVSFSITFTYGMIYLIFLFLSLILGLLYSIAPFRFKGRPIIDILSNAIGYGILAFGVGCITSNNFSWRLLLYAIPYFFATASFIIYLCPFSKRPFNNYYIFSLFPTPYQCLYRKEKGISYSLYERRFVYIYHSCCYALSLVYCVTNRSLSNFKILLQIQVRN